MIDARPFLFTSESVTEGHPDKMADNISDAVLDAMLEQDPASRVACETMISTGFVALAGEITSQAQVDFQDIVRSTINRIGYDHSDKGYDGNTCGVLVALDKQSPDISQGVTAGKGLFKDQGAGDQGLMFGYACDETPELMPAPIQYAHRLTEKLSKVRRNKKLPFLRPDGKSQVTIQYENGKPKRVDAVVISSHHSEDVKHKTIKEAVIEEVINPVIPAKLRDGKTKIYVNPTGRFVVGGPMGDCGLTGRKIIVDTYGGWGRHGGGAFSGKDPSKVDRSACYMARHIAKNIVAAKLATRAEVQVAYAIGVAKPVSVRVDAQGTGVVDEAKIEKAVSKVFDLRPAMIIEYLDLLKPGYLSTAAYGHFGRKGPRFTWEATDRAAELRAAAGLK